MKVHLFTKIFYFTLIACLWFSCQNSTSDKGIDFSNKKTIEIKKDLINIDSLIKSTNSDSLIFLNYSNFINEEIYTKIRTYNIAKRTLDTGGFYLASFNKNELELVLIPQFEKNKLISISLRNRGHRGYTSPDKYFDEGLERDFVNEIKNIYDIKYGNSIKVFNPKGKYKFCLKGQNGEERVDNSSYSYKYSNGNKIIILKIYCYDLKYPEEWKKNAGQIFDIEIEYFTVSSYNFLQRKNKSIEGLEKEKQKKKTDRTLKEL